jgi:prepilin-type N-terminal cleavage/methylation domain-containing protein
MEKESTMKALLKKAASQAKDKKGFTLVEIIVVLVILAILMAIAIPALTGYITKARQQSVTTEARTAQIALQAIGTDVIAHGGTFEDDATFQPGDTLPTEYAAIGVEKTFGEAITALSGTAIAGTVSNIAYTPTGQLNTFTYDNGTYQVIFTGGTYGAPTLIEDDDE